MLLWGMILLPLTMMRHAANKLSQVRGSTGSLRSLESYLLCLQTWVARWLPVDRLIDFHVFVGYQMLLQARERGKPLCEVGVYCPPSLAQISVVVILFMAYIGHMCIAYRVRTDSLEPLPPPHDVLSTRSKHPPPRCRTASKTKTSATARTPASAMSATTASRSTRRSCPPATRSSPCAASSRCRASSATASPTSGSTGSTTCLSRACGGESGGQHRQPPATASVLLLAASTPS